MELNNNRIIIIDWTLYENGIVNTWLTKEMTKKHNVIKQFYTGRTTGDYDSKNSIFNILYEYNIPLSNLSKIEENENGVAWKGYSNNCWFEFDFNTRKQNMKYHIQTKEEIDNIIYDLHNNNESSLLFNKTHIKRKKPRSHKFKKTNDSIICERCGLYPSSARDSINDFLYLCLG